MNTVILIRFAAGVLAVIVFLPLVYRLTRRSPL